jgi:hypothetical protein
LGRQGRLRTTHLVAGRGAEMPVAELPRIPSVDT